MKQKLNISDEERIERIERSSKLVGKAVFHSILITLISFAPILFLTGQEKKLFTPLVLSKTFAMIGSGFVAIFLVPVLMAYLLKGKMIPEKKHPVSRFFIRLYDPVLRLCLRWKKATVAFAFLLVAASIPFVMRLGSEFMPPLDEGSLLFMPVTLPDVSNSEIKRIMQVQDKLIKTVPEVDNVLGKAGRASTATDNAPVSMIETIITLKPHSQWREGMTKDKIIEELNSKMQIPGVVNGWTQPIINRVNMLSTGIRTDVGLKVYGQNLDTINVLSHHLKASLTGLAGVSDLYVEPIVGGKYVEIRVRKDEIGRYGLTVEDVNMVVESSIGGMNITNSIEGRQRFSVNARFAQQFRRNTEQLKRLLVTSPVGPVPLSAVADIQIAEGPPMINSENAMLRGTVMFNVRGRDMGSTVSDAKKRLDSMVKKLPSGYFVEWSGQYENQVRAEKRLQILIPVVLLIITVILYFTFRSIREVMIVLLSVPVALVGGAYSLYFFNVNFSVAVAVGFIALFGVAVETGVLMLVYLNNSLYSKVRNKATENSEFRKEDLQDAVYEGAVLRLRPKLMTVLVDVIGLLPVLFATGTGSDVMKPITIPFVFGLLTSTVFVLIVLPVMFTMIRERELKRNGRLIVAQLND